MFGQPITFTQFMPSLFSYCVSQLGGWRKSVLWPPWCPDSGSGDCPDNILGSQSCLLLLDVHPTPSLMVIIEMPHHTNACFQFGIGFI